MSLGRACGRGTPDHSWLAGPGALALQTVLGSHRGGGSAECLEICEKRVGPLSCLLLPLLGQQVPPRWWRWGVRERAETEESLCPLIPEPRELKSSSSSTQGKGAEAGPGLAPTCGWARTA